MALHAAIVRFEFHIPNSRSLKAKRAAIRPIVDGVRHRFGISVAEVDHLDTWQRCAIAVAVLSGSHRHAVEVIEEVERFVANAPEADLLDTSVTWVEAD